MNVLQQIHSNVETRIERFTQSGSWKLKYVLLLTLLAVSFATPAYHALPAQFRLDTWGRVQLQARHPFTDVQVADRGSQAGKKAFRLTVPLIAKAFRLNNPAIFALQNLLGMVFLYCVIQLTMNILADRISAVWMGLGVATVYFGRACFIDIYSWFDGWAYLFLILAMISKARPGIFIFCCLAAWTDERAAIALSWIGLWWLLQDANVPRVDGSRLLHLLRTRHFMVILAGGFYLWGRQILSTYYGLTTPATGTYLQIFYRQLDFLGIGGWTSLEGFWLIVLAGMLALLYQRRYVLLAGVLLMTGAFLFASLGVYDVTRSGAYLFPLVFICLHLLKGDESSIPGVRNLIMGAATVCLMFPAIFVITNLNPPTLWQKPFLVGAIKHMLLFMGNQ